MKPAATAHDSIRAVAIIPARLDSTRLERKMLQVVEGRPLVVHTAHNLQRTRGLAGVVVATDSEEIRDVVEAADVRALMTRADHECGTDRIQEAAQQLYANGAETGAFDVVLNVQGDEPEVDPEDLERLLATFHDPAVELATLAHPIEGEDEWRSPDVVKVVRDGKGDALYFSRAPIPARGHGAPEHGALRHVGVYAFRRDALARFCAAPRGMLEARERLEQLRWLEAGGRIRVVVARSLGRGIDTPRDLEAFAGRLAQERAERKRT